MNKPQTINKILKEAYGKDLFDNMDDVFPQIVQIMRDHNLNPYESFMCLSMITQRGIKEFTGPTARTHVTLLLHLAANYLRAAEDYILMNSKNGLSENDKKTFEDLQRLMSEGFHINTANLPGYFELEEMHHDKRLH